MTRQQDGEAHPGTDGHEIDRSEWESMAPAERAQLVETLADNHVSNQGGYGWGIEDADDEAMVGEVPSHAALQELADRLVSRDWMLPALDQISGEPARELAEVIRMAQKALGKNDA